MKSPKLRLLISCLAGVAIFAFSFILTSCSDDEALSETPELTASQPGNITSSSATIVGTFTKAGNEDVLQKGVVYSTDTEPDLEDAFTEEGPDAVDFSSQLTGLNPSTTYHVRAYATTASATVYSAPVNFTTDVPLAVCTPGTEQDLGINGPMAKDTEGFLWYAKSDNKIYKQQIDGPEQLIGGSGTASLDDGSVMQPSAFTWHPDGYLLFFDGGNALRKATPGGEITTLATFPGNGFEIAINSEKEIYVGHRDAENKNRISRLGSDNSLERIPELDDLSLHFDFGSNDILYYHTDDGIYTFADNQKTLLISSTLPYKNQIGVTDNGIIYLYYFDGVSRIAQFANGELQEEFFAVMGFSPIGMLVEKDGSGLFYLQSSGSPANSIFIPCE